MSKQDFINAQTHVLSVNFRCKCEGCKRRIKKQLQKIDGVYASAIDAEQGKVSVTGSVEPDLLIQKLGKSGKHAEILSSEGLSVFKTKNADQFDVLSSQLKNLKMSKGDRKKAGKDKQKDEGGGGKHSKQIAVQQVLQELKASGDSKPPPVKVKDDDIDGSEDEAFGDVNEDYQKKVVVVQVAGDGDLKVAGKHKKGGGHGGGVMSKMIGKATGGKYGNIGKTKGKIGNKGGDGGGFPDFEVTTSDNGGGGGNNGKIGNKGGGGGGFPDFEVTKHHNSGGGGEGGDISTPVQGLAATPMVSNNGRGVGPMGPISGNSPYQQQQPYMGLMNQPGTVSGGDMNMMHPPQGGGYGYGYAPPMPPPAYQDLYTNVFSDENPEGCSVM